jgi:hypothetical protein
MPSPSRRSVSTRPSSFISTAPGVVPTTSSWPRSTTSTGEPYRFFDARLGRPSVPIETYLWLMFLKYRYRLGFEPLCPEVSDSITWQRFTRVPLGGRVPHPTTLMKIDRVQALAIELRLLSLKRRQSPAVRNAVAELLVTGLAARERRAQGTPMKLLENPPWRRDRRCHLPKRRPAPRRPDTATGRPRPAHQCVTGRGLQAPGADRVETPGGDVTGGRSRLRNRIVPAPARNSRGSPIAIRDGAGAAGCAGRPGAASGVHA